jgi:hydrogenase maturation protein HypF
VEAYPFPFSDNQLDFRPLLLAVAQDRQRGRVPDEIARAFQLGVATGLYAGVGSLCRHWKVDTVVLSGGVFQNELLLSDLHNLLGGAGLNIWTNRAVPANDGGISLGQAALGAFVVKPRTA